MSGSYTGQAGVFLIETLFGLYMLIVMLRFLLQVVRADFYNPLSQFVVKATNPVLIPLRRVIPGLGGIDVSALIVLLVLAVVKMWLIAQLVGASPSLAGLTTSGVAEVVSLALNVFFFSILIQVILSWLNQGGGYNPIVGLLHSLNEPLLRPARRLMPPISGFDLSPIVVMVGIQLANILIVAPLRDAGRALL